jgi:multiple sugar transport system substrate-binding protein
LRVAALLVLAVACRSAASGDVVRFWAFGREGEVVAELVRDFERANPGIRVQVQQIPWTAAHEKLLTAHVGDVAPDVAQLGNTWIPEFVALDAIAPLDSFVATSGAVVPSAYFPGIWATNLLDGRLYGVPWYVDTRVIFYRKDQLARAGFATVPSSWAEWRRAMERLRALGVERGGAKFGIYLPTNEWAQPVLLGMQAGSPLLRDEWRYGAFADSAFRRAFDFYLGLYRDSLAPAFGNNDVANLYQEFARGTFAMYISGPWNLGEFRRRLPQELQDAWGTAPLPAPEASAAPGVSLAGGSSLVVFRRSRRPDAAWRLIEFLSRPEQQIRFFRLSGNLPSRVEAWSDSALAGDERAQAFRHQLDHVQAPPGVPEWEQITSKLIDHAEAAIRGGVPAARALAALDRDVAAILEKRRWLIARQRSEAPLP